MGRDYVERSQHDRDDGQEYERRQEAHARRKHDADTQPGRGGPGGRRRGPALVLSGRSEQGTG